MVIHKLQQYLSKGRHLSLPANIRLGWKRLTVTITLSYFDNAQITAAHTQGQACNLACKYYTRVEATVSNKHTSLLQQFTNYCSTYLRVGFTLACKYYTRVEATVNDTHSSLLQPFSNFCSIYLRVGYKPLPEITQQEWK